MSMISYYIQYGDTCTLVLRSVSEYC